MKVKKIVFYGLMFLPVIIALIALQFLPEQIPAHYGLNNQVTVNTRLLLFPLLQSCWVTFFWE